MGGEPRTQEREPVLRRGVGEDNQVLQGLHRPHLHLSQRRSRHLRADAQGLDGGGGIGHANLGRRRAFRRNAPPAANVAAVKPLWLRRLRLL
eukprot:2235925-Pleurochrysis_carterae.AAC.1